MNFRNKIEEYLTKANKTYSDCWETLLCLKKHNFGYNFIDSFFDFQTKLATALFNLEKFRIEIIKEEKRLIKNKTHYNPKWFNNRLKTLSTYKKALKLSTNVGKSLGDAFVWWFYRFDFELLHKHYNHNRNPHLPIGIGGVGELEFVKRIKHVQEKFTIYHGITNILRIGDVSFFDLEKMQIVSLGEIKTEKSGVDNVNISLIMFGPKSRTAFKVNDKISKAEKIEYFDKNRLNRQIRSMVEALKIYDDPKSNFEKIIGDGFYTKEIENLYKISTTKKLSFVQASSGLVFLGIKTRSESPVYKYLKSNTFKPSNKDELKTKDYMLKSVKTDSEYNSLVVGKLLYGNENIDNNIRGSIPLFWMDIDDKVLRDIYFQDFEVISMFNPVHLIEELIDNGVFINSNFYPEKKIPKDIKHPIIKVEYFDLFLPFIVGHLQTEKSVVRIVEMMKKEMFDSKLSKNTKAEIKMQQMIFEQMITPNR